MPISKVSWTNEKAPITKIIAMITDEDIPDVIERSWKCRCPLGDEHADGGMGRNFRIYSTNTAFCFETHGFLTPTSIIQKIHGVSAAEASDMIIEKLGMEGPKDWYEQTMALIYQDARSQRAEYLWEALQTHFLRIPGYLDRQYEEDVTEVTQQALDNMPPPVVEFIRKWVDTHTTNMREVLNQP